MSSKLGIAFARSAIGTAFIAALSVALPAHAVPTITLTDSWTEGSATHQTETNGGSLPTLLTTTTSTSNDGSVTPKPQTYTQPGAPWSPGGTATFYLFVAQPNDPVNGPWWNPTYGQTKADIPINFTLSDGNGGSATFTDWINFFADATPSNCGPAHNDACDSMAWSTTAASSPGFVSGTNDGAPSLVQTITLSDGIQIGLTLPYETDWNMAQNITLTYLSGGGGGGQTTVPEPSPLVMIGMGLAGLALLRRRKSESSPSRAG
jgi:hypothetical protein